jgi:hypothetical protein
LNELGRYSLGPGGRYGPVGAIWSFRADPVESFYASFISGAQRLANGNTLVCHGPQGLFFEVSPAGEEAWRYKTPIGPDGPVTQGTTLNGPSVFRALRYPLDHAAFQGRDLEHHGNIEIDPASIFQIFKIETGGDATTLRWNSRPDRNYQIFHNPGLDPAMWTHIGSVLAIGTESSFVDQVAERTSLDRGFYQVMRLD